MGKGFQPPGTRKSARASLAQTTTAPRVPEEERRAIEEHHLNTLDHTDELRLNPWFYVVGWFIITVLFVFLFGASGENDFLFFAAGGCSFVCVYVVYSKIERGKANISDVIRYVVAFIVLALGVGVVSVPLWLISDHRPFTDKVLELVAMYVGGIIVVVVLLTILSWMNDSSPWKELEKSFRLSQ
jgi:Trk-type K+ transport system membrane component